MTTALLLLLALAAFAVIAETIREVFHDGPSPQGPPRSHEDDRRFGPPASRAA